MEDKKFLTYFDELIAAQKQTSQRSAIFKIMKVLHQNTPSSLETKLNFGASCNPNVAYTLSRFVKGMASQSASVQQGFYLGFTMLLHYFGLTIDLKLLLKFVNKAMQRQPHALKPAENCQRVIGQIMLLRGICTAFFKMGQDKSHEHFQKAIQCVDEYIALVGGIYEENVKMVLGKRGGQSKNLYNLWFNLACNLLQTFSTYSSTLVRVINAFLDKLLDAQRSEFQSNYEWMACRVAVQIHAKHLASIHGISTTQLPLIPESFLAEVKRIFKAEDISCLLKISNMSLGIHPLFKLLSSQFIWSYLKSPKIAEDAKSFFQEIPIYFLQQPKIILFCMNSALEKIRDLVFQKQQFPYVQGLLEILTEEFANLIGKIYSNKFPKKESPSLKEEANQSITHINAILKELLEFSHKLGPSDSAVKIFMNLFSSSDQLVLASENKAILSSLTKLVLKEKKVKEKKKGGIDSVLSKIELNIQSELKEDSKEESENKNKALERITYQINLLAQVCQTSSKTEYLHSRLFAIIEKAQEKQSEFFSKVKQHCLNKVIVTAKSESLKELCQKMKELFKDSEESVQVLQKALEIGAYSEKQGLKTAGKTLKKRKHSEALKPEKLKAIEHLSYAIALTHSLQNSRKEEEEEDKNEESEDSETLQDLKDLEQIVHKLSNPQKAEEDSPDPCQVLFDLLVSQLTKQSAFLREYVYGTFKTMLEDISEASVLNILEVMSTPTQLAHGMLTL